MGTEPERCRRELRFLLAVYEMKSSVSDYLSLANVDGIYSLEELIEFNLKHAAEELPES